ncbi:unnamed protein product [Blepharisma stoltei]|uniref:Uncharacterized protein n=1 Tax=Blepharisma stoltei TaxID=1481888 RepID=A0AAU9K5V8_9CILI|nr:unnamed protein product [Blepharisma stoltei]
MYFFSPGSNKLQNQFVFPTLSPQGLLQNSLPSKFALEILNKENQLEKSWDPTTIHELIDIYSKAIEFYELHNDTRFYDYQLKIRNLLMKPQVIKALQNEPDPDQVKIPEIKPSESEEMPKKIETAESNKEKIENEDNELPALTVKENRIVKKILSNQKQLTHSTSSKALTDIKSQNSDLEVRLASRKFKHTTLNSSFRKNSNDFSISMTENLSTAESIDRHIKTEPDEEESETIDFSGFFNISNSSSEVEKRLENIMEKYITEKVNRISEVTVDYKLQMKELEDQGGIMKQVLEQMKVNMQEEIKMITEELDAQKAKEIEELKRELFIQM